MRAGEPNAGTIGDIFVMRSKLLGAAGVVTDGALRDTPAIRTIGLPVYHQSSHAATWGRMHVPLDHQVPIACAGVTVIPGDILVGDGEGVVVLPAALAEEIAAASVKQEVEEEWAWNASLRGRARSARSRSGRIAAPSSRRGPPSANTDPRPATALTEGGHAMPRRPIEATSVHHVNPIPTASRVGPLLMSSIIPPRNPGADDMPEEPEAQLANLFHHVGEMLEVGGAGWEHIVKMTFFVPDLEAPRHDQRAVGRALPRRQRRDRPATRSSRPEAASSSAATSWRTSSDGRRIRRAHRGRARRRRTAALGRRRRLRAARRAARRHVRGVRARAVDPCDPHPPRAGDQLHGRRLLRASRVASVCAPSCRGRAC